MGIIPVLYKKIITPESSLCTNAPITPSTDNLMTSYIFELFVMFKKGYKKTNNWDSKNSFLVLEFNAIVWIKDNIWEALSDISLFNFDGDKYWYKFKISWRRVAIVPWEYHKYMGIFSFFSL